MKDAILSNESSCNSSKNRNGGDPLTSVHISFVDPSEKNDIYHHQNEQNASICIMIKETTTTGALPGHTSGSIRKIMWKGFLEKSSTSARSQDINDTAICTSCNISKPLELIHSLGSYVNQLRRERSDLQSEIKSITKALDAWMYTAKGLDGELERREDELIENFVVLLNRAKSDLRKTRDDLELEKQKNKQLLDVQNQSITATPQKRKEMAKDYVDEHDFEAFDPEGACFYPLGICIPPVLCVSFMQFLSHYLCVSA